MKTEELIEPAQRAAKTETRIQLPYGLLGFERIKNYVLLGIPHEEPFMWLRMLDNAKQEFLVIPPFLVLPDYEPDIASADTEFLGLANPADALVIAIVTLRANQPATVNLKGPIVINIHTLTGKQVIPNNAARYSLRHPLAAS